MNIPSYHKDLGSLHIGCEKPRAYYIPFHSEEAALVGDREKSEFYFSLCGEWTFRFYNSFEDIGDDSLQKILDKGYMILGLDENFPPMGFRNDEAEIVGFDIDLAYEVAERLGVELRIQPIDWNAKEMELNNGNIDMIWNGMSVTAERAETMNLSKPYIANRQVIIVNAASGINGKADLASKKIAAQAGSSAITAMEADTATFASFGELVEFDNNNAAFLDLKAGRVDAFVVDEVLGRYIIGQDAE